MGARILIVDDEQSLVYSLRQALQLEFPGIDVAGAFSGEEALSRLAETLYDLIIVDQRMPGLDGLALIKGVRYLDEGVPVILITGYGTTALREEAARLRIDYCLDKPFDIRELMAAVARCLKWEENARG